MNDKCIDIHHLPFSIELGDWNNHKSFSFKNEW